MRLGAFFFFYLIFFAFCHVLVQFLAEKMQHMLNFLTVMEHTAVVVTLPLKSVTYSPCVFAAEDVM